VSNVQISTYVIILHPIGLMTAIVYGFPNATKFGGFKIKKE